MSRLHGSKIHTLTGSTEPVPWCALPELIDWSSQAVALRHAETAWTFRELRSQAGSVAASLLALGLQPEDRVAVVARRATPEVVAALFGVMLAGGAYVVLDPEQPDLRLASMLADARPLVTLVENPALPVTASTGTRLALADACAGPEPHHLPWIDPRSAAYVMFTSGSTGRPKGVVVEHRSLVNYLGWATRTYGMADGHGAPAHSPLFYDLGITALFGPLLAGRTVVLPAGSDHALIELGAMLEGGGFSTVKVTPAHLEAFELMVATEDLPGLTGSLVIGGEQLRGEMLNAWRRSAPDTLVFNEYGPTEATVGCCVHVATAGSLPDGPVPIGTPIANTRLAVVDPEDWTAPADPAAPGELLISGDCLARGYLGAAAATAERFVPDPEAGGGARAYRTGDLVSTGLDGLLRFVGRVDGQIKVNGHRVELEEIETAVQADRAVRQAVVLAQGRVLTAFVTPTDSGDSAREARAQVFSRLLRRLPAHMMPRRIFWLESFPLNANGKVDRKALPTVSPLQVTKFTGSE